MKHARKRNIRRHVAAAAAAVALTAVMAGGSLAYFNADGKADNVITTKGVAVALHEYQDDGTGAWTDYPEEPVGGVMPGDTVSKIPVAESDAKSAPAWVRMRAAVTVTSADGEALDASVVALDFNAAGWTYRAEDGWWYCNEALASGGQTEPLFRHMAFAAGTGNPYQRCTIDVQVYMQAVQTANNGASALEAAGWPADGAQKGGE